MKIQPLEMPLKPIRITCSTCKGRKKLNLSNTEMGQSVTIDCNICKGTGEYSVKRL